MITTLEINRAINNKIKSALVGTSFEDVPLLAEDIEEPIIRPSFKIILENATIGKLNANCKEKTLRASVYFFAKDRNKYKKDNTSVQDILENEFIEGLEVAEGFFIPIEEIEFEVSDTVLMCSFDLYTLELIDNDSSEIMEEFIYN